MSGFNKVILLGNLTKDPEKRYTASGIAVTNLRLAVSRKFKSGDQDREEVLFIDIVVWRQLAETCAEYLHKGRQVLVEGRLVERKWETEDGQKRSKVEVQADTVRFVGSRGDDAGGAGGSGGSRGPAAGGKTEPQTWDEGGGTPSDDDIPF
jgi:single-strand DNA-binding protein